MASKMLIDAAHPEETRVVVVKGNRVEEFDYESASKKQLRGNIYLAKVTRVEPSLQAAFVDYGGNRHGFLAFTEIHPDYYQIPVADRQALLDEDAAEQSRASAEEAAEDEAASSGKRRRRGRRGRARGESRRQGQSESRDIADETNAPEALESLPIAKFELEEEDEIDTTPSGDDSDSDIALAANDLVHEVSEPAEPGDEDADDEDGEAEAIGPASADENGENDAPQAAGSEPALASGEAAPEYDSSGPDEPRSDESESIQDDDDIEANDGAIDDADEDSDELNGDASPATNGDGGDDDVESVGSEDAMEEVPERARRRRSRPYKIQEVIRRRQIILVQVVKEERGNKGAALTTYLSLAGRYTVLMPNTARGGGISRKITQPNDRKRLREIAGELEVPEGMGLIIRTAGAQRTKTEIKRDYDYLLRLWETVRDLTLESTAPSLVYEEGSLIKRSIRDLYNKEIDEVLVAGDDAYREAKDFMRMLMPSHAKNVKPYKEPEPIFIRHQVERHLAAMFSPQVTLKSGGYIVINQTEALVSVDVNSGKATREHSIEDTALKTNLEASEEIARQLRLRDLAGLIVIDFIDMDERRNNRNVERRLKEALRNDRARIQVGRISHFGLLEMSRQRLRTGVLEGSTNACVMCQGTGIVRSIESVALDILRSVEDRLITDGVTPLCATTAVDVSLYILNQKRAHLKDIESRYNVPIIVNADKELHISQFVIERATDSASAHGENPVVQMDWAHHTEPSSADAEAELTKRRPRRRRRGRRQGEGETELAGAESGSTAEQTPESTDDETDQQQRKPRRRGRRGGRRGRGQSAQAHAAEQGAPSQSAAETTEVDEIADANEKPEVNEIADAGEPPRQEQAPVLQDESHCGADHEAPSEPDAIVVDEAAEPPYREPEPELDHDPEPAFDTLPTHDVPTPIPEIHLESEVEQDPAPRRKGWWSRG